MKEKKEVHKGLIDDSKFPNTIIGVDFEMLAGYENRIIAIGIAVMRVAGSQFTPFETHKFPLLHPSRQDSMAKDSFWRDKDYSDISYDGTLTETEMFNDGVNKFKKLISAYVDSDPSTVVVVGCAQDTFVFGQIGYNPNYDKENNYTDRLIVLRSLYEGMGSRADVSSTCRFNSLAAGRKANSNVDTTYKRCMRKWGPIIVHDCVDDSKNAIMLYVAALIGLCKNSSDLLRIL
jgi:hypothetical protein